MLFFIPLRRIVLVTVLLGLSFTGTAQNIQTRIKTEALEMARAMAAFDFDTYSKYLYPGLANDVKYSQMIRQGIDSADKYRKQFGIRVKSVLIGNPSKVVVHKKIMQSLLSQTTTVEAILGTVTTENTLVALSKDGKTWYFVDASMYRQPDAKQKLPELSPELVIPVPKPPVITPAEQQIQKN
jgi:hypothetical protein